MKTVKRIKKFISVMLCLIIVLSSGVTGMTIAYAESTQVAMTKSGLVGGNITSSRYSQNVFNIINDGLDNNTTVGLWSYDINDREDITGAQLTAEVTQFSKASIDNLYIDFYYVNPADVSDYLKDINESNKITNIDSIATNAGDGSVAHIKTLFSLSEKNLIGSLSHNYSTTSNTQITLDLSTAYYDMTVNNWDGICILAMCNKNNNGASNYNWSDTWLKLGDITYTKGNKALTLTKSAVLTGGSGNSRYNGNMFNIVNDGANTCTTIGLWSYDINDIKYITSATLDIFVNNYYKANINDLSIDFYYIDPSKASAYLKDLSVSDKTATDSEYTANMGDNSVTWAKKRFELTDSNKIGSLSHNYTSSLSRHLTLDLSDALNSARQQKQTSVCILAMCNKNNNGASGYNWSDTWISTEKIYYTESSTYIPIDKTGILCGTNATNRNNGNIFNIINDSLANNTTVGLWSYDITDIKATDKASVTATSTKWSQTKIDNFGIEFYLIDSQNVTDYLKPLSSSQKATQYSVISSNAGDTCTSAIKTALGLTDENKVGYLEHDYTDNKNKYFNLDISSAVQKAKKDNIQNITLIALCNKNNNGNTSKLWSDVWIEISGMTYGADITAAAIQPLKNAMTEYENMLSSGKIYKNMGHAYNAYVNAQKVIDAYSYGNMTSIDVNEYTDALTSAITSMTEWSAPNPNVSPKFSSSDTGTIPINTGCLWYEYSDDPLITSYAAEGYNTTTNIYYQNGVYLYTDSSPNIPYLVGFYRTSSSITASPQNPKVLFVSLLSQNGGLYIKNSLYNGDICSREFATIMGKNYRINATETGSDNNIILSTGDMRYMANYFCVNQSAFSSSSYYVEAKPTGFKEGYGTKDTGTTVKDTKNITNLNDRTFYVINYKPLLEQINSSSNKNMIKNVALYKQGGLQSLMDAYDTATAVDPTSYDYSSSTLTKVNNCANDIRNAVNKFTAVTSVTRDNTNYELLRNAIDESKSIGNHNPVISSDTTQAQRYSQDSFNTYFNALTQAQNAMSNVLNADGYNGSYNSKTVSAIAKELENSKQALKYNYIVEFISASKQDMGSLIVTDGQTVDTSAIVNTPTVKGIQERQSHIVYSWTPITVTYEEYGDDEVITINETAKEEACEETLGAVITEPTCSAPGLRESICSVCNAVYQIETDTLEHNYTSEVIAPTCTQKGYTLYTCTNCGNSYKDDYTDVIEHSYIDVTVNPTCTERGYTAKRCSVCSHEEIDENSYTSALGHEYTSDVIREADCTFKSVVEYVCIRHDNSYTEETEINENNHPVLIYSRTVEPTASESGYDIYYCNNLCGYWEKRNIVPPTKSEPTFADCINAYNAALETIVEELTPYTEESKLVYTQRISEAKAMAEQAIENEDTKSLDSATASIIEATALLRIKTVSINLLVCDANGEIVTPSEKTLLASYGDIATLDISNETNGLNVEKWTVEQNGKTVKLNNTSAYCDINAYGNSTVVAYLTENTTAEKKKITLQNKNGKVIGVKYIDETGNIELNNQTLFDTTAPTVPFYTFDKWQVIANDSDGITLKATYKATQEVKNE